MSDTGERRMALALLSFGDEKGAAKSRRALEATRLQIGPIVQYVTSLTETHDALRDPHHGLEHQSG